MWEARHSLRSDAAPAAVWALWTDPARWPDWNEAVSRVELQGSFEVGTVARVKLKGGGTLSYRITRVEHERLFVAEARLPGARLGHEHRIDPAGSGIEISNRIYLEGPATRLYALLMGGRARKSLPGIVERERELAEQARR